MAQLGGGYKILQMLAEWWAQIQILLGLIERAAHEAKKKEIQEQTEIVKNPNSTEEERREAVKKLQDIANRHVRR